METGSLILLIKTGDFYQNITENVERFEKLN